LIGSAAGGTLLQRPGYDQATGFYLATNTASETIPDKPTAEAAAASREFLLERFPRDLPGSSG